MEWLAVIIVLIILIPLGIFILRRLMGLLGLMCGVLGVVCLIAQHYLAGIIFIAAAAFFAMLSPPDDPDTDYF